MENNNLDKFLQNKMSVDESDIYAPSADLISEARSKVVLRKKKVAEPRNFFTFISGIFNMQIKLYQAGLATLIIAGYIYYFTKSDAKSEPTVITQYVNNNSSVNSSTVLASILTFIVRN